MVLIKSAFTDVHIRTRLNGGWAGIDNVAISIGTPTREVLEVQNDAVFYKNAVGVTTAVSPATVAGYALTVSGPVGSETFVLDLLGSQEIEIVRYNFGAVKTMSVTVHAHGSNFLDAQGICGKWTAAAPGMVGRDGVSLFTPAQGKLYGEEWQVDTSAPSNDPALFVNATANVNCTYGAPHCFGEACQCNDVTAGVAPGCCTKEDPQCQKAPLGRRSLVAACDTVPDIRDAKNNCEFDVFTTGIEEFATKIRAYVSPIPNEPSPQCTDTTADVCKNAGGTCVWKCDSTKTKCRVELCTASTSSTSTEDSDCACEIIFDGSCDNWLLAIIDFLFGWFFLWILGIDLCP